MPGELGPIEIVCDAPPYLVVKACAGLGFRCPLDVRWCRLDRRHLHRPGTFFPWLRPGSPPCTCGEPVPELEGYTFTFATGGRAEYFLVQCRRCRTIFWDVPG